MFYSPIFLKGFNLLSKNIALEIMGNMGMINYALFQAGIMSMFMPKNNTFFSQL